MKKITFPSFLNKALILTFCLLFMLPFSVFSTDTPMNGSSIVNNEIWYGEYATIKVVDGIVFSNSYHEPEFLPSNPFYFIDTDGDTIEDAIDIDDDNDGILDVDEQDCAILAAFDLNNLSWHGPAAANVSTPSATRLEMTGAAWSTTYSDQEFSLPLQIEGVIRTSGGGMIGFLPVSGTEATSHTWSDGGYKFQFNASNGMYIYHSGTNSGWHGPSLIGKKFILAIDAEGNMTYSNDGVVVFTRTVPVEKYKLAVTRGGGIYKIHQFVVTTVDPNCGDINTDGDALVDRLDLDSDGDGCSDSVEAGNSPVSSNSTSNYNTGADVNNNGLLDRFEEGTTGTINYKSTYSKIGLSASLNACSDTDNDGIGDLADIDDDNDGILDATESPDCYFTEGEATQIVSISSEMTVESASRPFDRAIDGDDSTSSYTGISPNKDGIGKSIYEIESFLPIAIHSIEFSMYNLAFTNGSANKVKLQGFTGTTWENLSSSSNRTVKNAKEIFENTKHPDTKYKKFRITGSSGVVYYARVKEIYINVNNYNASEYTKADCTTDLDGDTVLNHLDLDSDGDNCSDSVEVGNTLIGANSTTVYKTGADANANGLLDEFEEGTSGTLNYGPAYNVATDTSLNGCLDTDGDGIGDVIDIDDDNDGILDTDEQNCIVTTAFDLNELSWHGPAAANVSTPTASRLTVTGSAWSTAYSDQEFSLPFQIEGVVSTVSNGMIGFLPVSGTEATSNTWSDGGFKFQFNASNGMYIYHSGTNSGWHGPSLVGKKFILAIDAEGNMTYSNNGVVVYTRTVPVEKYKLAITRGAYTIDSFVVTTIDPNCGDINTDGDALVNRLDLDSDGDGCNDSVESGNSPVSSNNISDYNTGADVNKNGLLDKFEEGTTGTINYVNTYSRIGLSVNLNACSDTDNDGVGDLADIDDDNDGILDATESPDCYFTEEEATRIVSISSEMTIESTSRSFDRAIDGNDSTSSYTGISPNQDGIGKSIYEIESFLPIAISSIEFSMYNLAFTNGSANKVRLQGFTGVAWENLSHSSNRGGVNGKVIFNNINHPDTKYKKFRITGSSGVVYYARVKEIYINVNNYNASEYTKADCTTDLDGDTVLNHLDLDSDGDNCSDSVEVGNTLIGANSTTVYKTGADANANGLLDEFEEGTSGTLNYGPAYNVATDTSLNGCLDTDGDGIGDVIDIDDDNDGILDTDEQNCIVTTAFDLNELSWHGPAAANVSTPTASRLTVTGSAWSTAYSDQEFSLPFQIEGVVSTVSNGMIGFLPVSGTEATSNTWSDGGFKFQFNASNGMYIYHSGTNSGWHGPSLVGKKFILAIDAEGNMTYSNNGVVVYTRTVPVEKYKLAITRGAYTIDSFVVTTIDPNCGDINTDGDALVNRLDLDSDGDGCNDSVESGNSPVSSNNLSDYNTGADVNKNGLLDRFEEGTTGTINYENTYSRIGLSNSLNACSDTDNDGVGDLADIDDDNDGVLDAIESPACYFTKKEATTIIRIKSEITTIESTSRPYENAIDGDDSTSSYTGFSPNQNGVGKSIYEMEPFLPITISSVEFSMYNLAFTSGNANKVKLQGFTGTTWEDLGDASNRTVVNGKEVFKNTKHPDTKYKKFRITGSSGVVYYARVKEVSLKSNSYNASEYTKAICTEDTDEDGVFNHLDLDSDGDGCSDSIESGNTLITDNNTTSYKTGTDANANGLLDEFEDGTSGALNYDLTYINATSELLNSCSDLDGDGIGDLVDIDDDNDGIKDSDESPSCFGTKDMFEAGIRSDLITVSTDLTMNSTYKSPKKLVDGKEETSTKFYAVGFTTQSVTAKEIYRFDFETAIELEHMYLVYYNTYSSFNRANITLQGSNNGNTWVDLNSGTLYDASAAASGIKNKGSVPNDRFDVTQNAGAYKSYRLFGNSGNTYVHGRSIEVLFSITNFIRENYPLATCFDDEDMDGDGKFNHQDTDMDGDGSLDIVESGAGIIGDTTISGSVGTNGLANNLETSPDSGLIDYKLQRYYIDNTLNASIDADGDGIGDLIDIDDDNDGILDTVESSDCPIDLNSASYRRWLRQTISIQTIDRNDAPPYQIRRVLNNLVNFEDFPTCFPPQTLSNNVWFEITFPEAVRMNAVEFAISGVNNDNSRPFFSNGTVVILYGVNAANQEVEITRYTENGSISPGELINHSNVIRFSFDPPAEEMTKFVFRARGRVLGMSSVTEINFGNSVTACIDLDSDGDDIPNRLDLDSDGDECSDSVEASNTLVSDNDIVVYKTGADVNRNGLLDEFEIGTTGTINYDITYRPLALSNSLNACLDTDGDGVGDLIDIDDDNDGVLDAIESPECFYSKEELESPMLVTSQLQRESASRPFSNAHDGNDSTSSYTGLTPNQAAAGKTIYEITPIVPIALKQIAISMYNLAFTNGTANTMKLQGYLGNEWEDLDVAANRTKVNAREVFVNTLHPDTRYEKFRIVGVNGTAYYARVKEIYLRINNFNASNYGKPTCTADADEDDVLNHLDLDSDDDDCSDSVESGNTLISDNDTTTYKTGADANANGLLDEFERGTTGALNYTPTYVNATSELLNGCSDLDGDGIGDLVDIDDDNDGIKDSDESPSCFGTKDMFEAGIRGDLITASTALTMHTTYNDPKELVDGLEETSAAFYAVGFTTQSVTDKEIYRFDFESAIELENLYLVYYNTYSNFNGANITLQGSNDGSTWVDLNAGETYTTSATRSGIKNKGSVPNDRFDVTQNAAAYMSYRLFGNSGNTYVHGRTIEVLFEITNFIRENYPLPTCFDNEDLDGDGKFNHQDTDMDGDDCLDIVESGAGTIGDTTISGSVGTNGLADNLETSADSGLINYELQRYYIDEDLNACLDTDGDGIGDLIDIDDDNDGVLDIVESSDCPIDLNSASYRRWLRQTISIQTIDRNDAPPYQIRRVFNNLVNFEDFPTCFPPQSLSNNVWFEITFPEAVRMNAVEFAISGMNNDNSRAFFGNGTVVVLYGVNAANQEVEIARYTENGSISPGVLIDHSNVIRFSFDPPAEEMTKFIFRASGRVLGMSSVTEVRFGNSVTACVDLDSDDDGIPNRLDLDSDDDECSDSVEASNTLATDNDITTYKTGADVNGNGLLDEFEIGTTGTINYDITYRPLALSASLNACIDTDGDGIGDLVDIDDDNDGILDIIESPDCFYSKEELERPLLVTSQLLVEAASRPFSNAHDGNDTNASYTGLKPNQSSVGKSVYEITPIVPIALKQMAITMHNLAFTNGAANTMKLQGYLGNAWEDLDVAANRTVVNAREVFVNTLHPDTRYEKFRIVGVTGNAYYARVKEIYLRINDFNTSSYGKSICTSDTDGDDVLNHLDLDSDGDDCSDSVEAGNTLVSDNDTTTYKTGADVNTNGLLDEFEDGASGTLNYIPTYAIVINSSLNGCLDTDGDGIGDVIDIDDDNDGVLDVIETYSCFVSSIGDRTSIVNVSTELTLGANCIFPNSLVDGVVNDTIVRFGVAKNQTVVNKTALQFSFKREICLKKVYLQYPYTTKMVPVKDLPPRLVDGAFSHFAPGTVLKLQGSNDGSTWTNLNSGSTYGTDPVLSSVPSLGISNAYLEEFTIDQNSAKYSRYRVRGVSGSTSTDMSGSIEVYFESCQSCDLDPENDTDQDGIINSLDLDSDGDECSDSVESGNTLVSDNNITTYKTGADVNSNGLLDEFEDGTSGELNYDPSYNLAINAALNACLDTDGDGVGDLIDIDDDNDGVLDIIETYSCFVSSIGDRTSIVNVSTELNLGANCIFPNSLVDGVVNDTIVRFGVAKNQTVVNKTALQFSFNREICLKKVYLQYPYTTKMVPVKDLPPRLVDGAFSHFAPGTVLQLQGSNNGATWTNLNNGSTYGTDPALSSVISLGITNAYLEEFTISKNSAKYKKYRIQGISGSTSTDMSGSIEVYFESCQSCELDPENDTDQDGIINSLDLDSDGDNCSDSVESGNTSALDNDITNYKTGADVNSNGLLDEFEEGTSGELNYDPSYNLATNNALNACLDTDGDGVGDLIDIDDDNDGILDADESPDCFYTEAEATTIINVTSELNIESSARPFTRTYDGNDSTASYSGLKPNQNAIGKSVYEITPTIAIPVGSIEFSMYNIAFTSGTVNKLKMQGYTGSVWEDLDVAATRRVTNAREIFTNTLHPNTKYEKFRITGEVGVVYYSRVKEIYINAPNFIASASAKPNCQLPTGSDGVYSHLDVDSDNDGIYDAIEAGHGKDINAKGSADAGRIAVPDVGPNGFSNPLEEGVETGRYKASYNGGQGPLDSDTDDLIDAQEIDSDDDGCLDVDEAYNNFFQSLDTDGNGTYGDTGTVVSGYVDADGAVVEASYQTPVDTDGNGKYDYQEAGIALSDFAKINSILPLEETKYVGESHSITASLTSVNLFSVQLNWIVSADKGVTWSALENNAIYSDVDRPVLKLDNITEDLDGTLYKLVIYANNNVCSSITSDASSLLNVVACEINLATADITTSIPTSCAPGDDGSITIANAGLGLSIPFKVTYVRDGGAVETVSPNPITDATGTLVIPNLEAGVYSQITVSSPTVPGCTETLSTDVIIIEYENTLEVTASATASYCVTCDSGSLSATASEGSGVYTSYVWDLIALLSDGSSQDGIYNTQNVTDVPAGKYRVTVTDSKGCEASEEVDVTLIPDYQPEILADIDDIIDVAVKKINFRIDVSELSNIDSDPSKVVEIRIPRDSRLTINYNNTLIELDGVPVDNSDWQYNGTNPGLHKFTYIGNAGVYPKLAKVTIGVTATFHTPSGLSGTYPLRVVMKANSGGQKNTKNDQSMILIRYKRN